MLCETGIFEFGLFIFLVFLFFLVILVIVDIILLLILFPVFSLSIIMIIVIVVAGRVVVFLSGSGLIFFYPVTDMTVTIIIIITAIVLGHYRRFPSLIRSWMLRRVFDVMPSFRYG